MYQGVMEYYTPETAKVKADPEFFQDFSEVDGAGYGKHQQKGIEA